MAALRIGILANGLSALEAWELSLLARLAEEESLELAALIVDGRDATPRKPQWGPGPWLFRKIAALDERLFLKGRGSAPDGIRERIAALPTLSVAPRRDGRKDIFGKDDADAVRELGLDVLLQLGFGEIEGDLLAAVPFAIWSVFPGDDREESTGQPGFRCLREGAALAPVTLLVNIGGPDAVRVVARARFDRQASYAKMRALMLEKSAALVLREFKRLAFTRRLRLEGTAEAYLWCYRSPGLLATLGYCLQLALAVADKLFNRLVWRLGLRTLVWAPFIGRLPEDLRALPTALRAAREITPKRGQYWADPFLFRSDSGLYLFFENFSYSAQRGRISVGRIEEEGFEFIGDALVRDHHLSYPFLFQEAGEIYMIPETHETRRIEVWRCAEFPLRWELAACALEGTSVVDSTLFKKDDTWWLFCNIAPDSFADHTSELHVFRADGPLLQNLVPHRLNPVIVDSASARNGGRVFERGGKLFRASQNNSYGIYGYGLNLMEITALTLETYREDAFLQLEPDFRKGIVACHHFDLNGEDFVVDGRKRFAGF